jgi:hypothetical protein
VCFEIGAYLKLVLFETSMAIVVQRIEKEFLLGMLRNKRVPVKCFLAKKEYTFFSQSANEEQLIFTSQDDLSVFQKNMKLDLKFSVQSAQMPLVTFSVHVCEITGKHLFTFYGCKFEDMKLEDVRFLFESIYGRPFTGKDLEFITGSV